MKILKAIILFFLCTSVIYAVNPPKAPRSVQNSQSYMCQISGSTEQKVKRNLQSNYEYRLILIHQDPRYSGLKRAAKYVFEKLRSQVGKWSNSGKQAVWHWAIQIKKKSEKSYCSIGLKKSVDGKSTELTTPDVYDSYKCWRTEKSMGCKIFEEDKYNPINQHQAAIINLVLKQRVSDQLDNHRQVIHHMKSYQLPFKFSYFAHTKVSTSKDLFNCNKFGNNFKNKPEDLLRHIIMEKLNKSLK